MSQRLHLGLILPSVYKETVSGHMWVKKVGVESYGNFQQMGISREGDFGVYAIYLTNLTIYCQLLKGRECTLYTGVERD